MRAGFLYHEDFLKHDTGGHPENADRLRSIFSAFNGSVLKTQIERIEPRPATDAELAAVHTVSHVSNVESTPPGYIDYGDTLVSRESARVARLAAGGGVAAIEAVMQKGFDWVFCAVRPPGHHATPNQAMGFCLYNNIAIAAKAALNSLGAARVFIFDWDVHHGNGTQDAFYEDPRVLFMSVHQSPLYPGSGRIEERGAGKGEGYTLNIPFPPGCSDQDYLYAVQDLCLPALKKYNPDLVLISAGFDAHERDPLASQRLSSQAYASMARMIQLGAEGTQAKGRIVIFLEGGYDRTALAQSVVGVMESLYNRTPAEPPAISGASREAADRVRRIKEKFPEWYG